MHTQVPKLANEINKILTEKGYSSNNPLAVDGKVQIHILYSCDDKTSAASPPLQPWVEQTRFRRNLFENQ